MQRPIRLLHLITESGRSAYFRALAECFDRRNFEVTLATLQPAGALNQEMEARGVRTFSLDCRGRADYPRALLRLALQLRKRQIDVLQTHLFDASLVGLAAGRLAGTPVNIFTGHHSHEVILIGKRLNLAADSLASRWLSTHVIVHCQQMKDDLVRSERVPADKVAVLPLGFDLGHWQPAVDARPRIRAQLGLQDRTVLGAIGRLFWVKDYPRLFQVFGALARQRPELALLVLGDGPEREALTQAAAQLAPPGSIVFAGNRPDVADCLAAMDLFVHASISESFCQVLVEAQLLQLPVVSTRVGIALELVSEGANGWLADPGDSASLQAALQRALDARGRWPEMGRLGHQRSLRYSIQRTVAEHERQFDAWLAQARPGMRTRAAA